MPSRRPGHDRRRGVVALLRRQGPNLAFEHPGRVVLVGQQSGKVRVSKRLRWVPLVNGRLPAFFASPSGYASKATASSTARGRAAPRRPGPRGRREHAEPAPPSSASPTRSPPSARARCASPTRSATSTTSAASTRRARASAASSTASSRLNAGFVSQRYTARAGRTPIQSAQRLIDDGCRDLFLYVAGSGTETRPGRRRRRRPPARRPRDPVAARSPPPRSSASSRANRNVTFKLVFDAPYAGPRRRSGSATSRTSPCCSPPAAPTSRASRTCPRSSTARASCANPATRSGCSSSPTASSAASSSFVALPDGDRPRDRRAGRRPLGLGHGVDARPRRSTSGPRRSRPLLLGRRDQRVPFTTSGAPRTPPPAARRTARRTRRRPARSRPPRTPPGLHAERDRSRRRPADVRGHRAADPRHALRAPRRTSPTRPTRTSTATTSSPTASPTTAAASASETITLRVTPDNDSAAVIGGPGLTPVAVHRAGAPRPWSTTC